jgi:hypothetical protein
MKSLEKEASSAEKKFAQGEACALSSWSLLWIGGGFIRFTLLPQDECNSAFTLLLKDSLTIDVARFFEMTINGQYASDDEGGSRPHASHPLFAMMRVKDKKER